MQEIKKYYFHGVTSDDKRFTITGIYSHKSINLGIAICGQQDNFNKKLGIKISSGRLMSSRYGRGYTYISIIDKDRTNKERQTLFTKYMVYEYEGLHSDYLKSVFNLNIHERHNLKTNQMEKSTIVMDIGHTKRKFYK